MSPLASELLYEIYSILKRMFQTDLSEEEFHEIFIAVEKLDEL